jgi:hypothetical protein
MILMTVKTRSEEPVIVVLDHVKEIRLVDQGVSKILQIGDSAFGVGIGTSWADVSRLLTKTIAPICDGRPYAPAAFSITLDLTDLS